MRKITDIILRYYPILNKLTPDVKFKPQGSKIISFKSRNVRYQIEYSTYNKQISVIYRVGKWASAATIWVAPDSKWISQFISILDEIVSSLIAYRLMRYLIEHFNIRVFPATTNTIRIARFEIKIKFQYPTIHLVYEGDTQSTIYLRDNEEIPISQIADAILVTLLL